MHMISRHSTEGSPRAPPPPPPPPPPLSHCFLGYATLVRDNDAGGGGMEGDDEPPNVHGVLYEISASELQQLCRAEGGYHLADVTVRA